MTDLLADTYAFVAALDGSRTYQRLLSSSRVATTHLNALEYAQAILRRGTPADLDRLLPPVLDLCISPDPNVVRSAALFREERRVAGAKCSTVDAWGYCTARHLGMPFLTGDEDFRGVPGVRFVKA